MAVRVSRTGWIEFETQEGAEYEVLAPEGVATGERVSGYAVLAGQSRHHGASMSRWGIGDWAGNAVRSVVPGVACGSMT